MNQRVQIEDRLRLWMIVLLRIAAVVWLPIAFLGVVRFAEVVSRAGRADASSGGFLETFVMHGGVGPALVMLGHVAALITLIFFSRGIVCWIIPAADTCPVCKYDVTGVKGHRCPECGQVIRIPRPASDDEPE